jgi:hypothetical protein
MSGHTSLVKSVLASQAIYHLTLLNIAHWMLKLINKLERDFLWEAKDSTTGAKCKVILGGCLSPKKVWWLMHVKYMHELCSLLMHIPTYYNVISCYNHDLQLFMGIFHRSPLFWL